MNFWSELNDIISKTINKIFMNEQLSQTVFNAHNEVIYFNESTVRSTLYNLMNKGDLHPWCGELNLYTQFDYLYTCIKLLKLYLITCSIEHFFSNNRNINGNNVEKQTKNINRNHIIFHSLKNVIQKIFIHIFNSLNFKYFNKKYTYFILSFFYEIKELLTQFISEDLTTDMKSVTKKVLAILV